MEVFHCSTITGTRSKVNTINTTNIYPYDETSYYLYPSHLTFNNNAFHCPNQRNSRPNIQVAALLPSVATTLDPTLQHTARLPRVTNPHSADPIANCNRSRVPIPPLDNEPVSCRMLYGQCLSNLYNAELSPSAASFHQLSKSFITKWPLTIYEPGSGETLKHIQLCF